MYYPSLYSLESHKPYSPRIPASSAASNSFLPTHVLTGTNIPHNFDDNQTANGGPRTNGKYTDIDGAIDLNNGAANSRE